MTPVPRNAIKVNKQSVLSYYVVDTQVKLLFEY